MAKKINNEQDLRKLTKETSVVVEDALRSIASNVSGIFKQALEETQDVSKSLVKDTTTSLNSLAKVSNVLATNMEKAANGTLKQKDVLKTIQERQSKIAAIESQIEIVGRNNLKSKKALEKELQKIKESEEEINAQLNKQLERSKQINKNMGVTGNILTGISKIPILGNFIDAEEALMAAQVEASKQGATRAKAMSAAFSQMGKTMKEKLTDPLVLFGVGLSVFKSLINLGLRYDQITADIARNQGISTTEAQKTQEYLREAASNSKDLLATTENFAAAQASLNDSFGTSADFSSKTLEDFTNLTKKLGLTNEEAAVFAGFSATTGKTSEQIVNSIGKQNKGVINNKKVLSEVAKVSGQLYAQYKGNPIEIAKAVVQTQKLGMSLQQASSASKNLLNFEESISAELEAELLTGRDLNLEKARYLALQGDSAGAAAELMKNVGSLKDFTRLNVIQQEALARAVGMSADELTDSLRKQEQLKELNQGQVKIYQKQIQELRDKGRIEEADALEQQMLQGKSFELSKIQLSAQEKLSAAADKLKDTFAAIVAGPIGSFVSKFVDIIAKIASTKIGQIALGGAAIVALGAAILAMTRVFGRMAITGAMPVTIVGGGIGGVGGGGGVTDMISGGLGGGRKAGLGKQLMTAITKPKVLGRALSRAGGGSMLGGLGRSALGGVGGKVIAPLTSVAMTGKGLFDFFSDEKLRDTGVGGFFESLGGTGMNLLDTLTFGGTKLITNATGISIPGMETDDVASARAIFHDSGRDPDDSRFPISTDNKQLIEDILKNPSAYPEGIVTQAQGVNITELAVGGMVTRPTRALIGEAGPEAVVPLDKFYAKLDELIMAVKSGGNVYLDGTRVGTAMNVSTYKVQ